MENSDCQKYQNPATTCLYLFTLKKCRIKTQKYVFQLNLNYFRYKIKQNMGKKRQNEEKTNQNEYDLSSKHLKTSHVRANDKR